MKLSLKRVLTMAGLIALFGFFAKNIVSNAMAESPALSRPEDTQKAQREVSPLQGRDFRLGLPQGSYISARGIIEPLDRPIEVAGSVPGRIASLAVREGERVKAGDPLVYLDSEIESALLAATQAERVTAEAELSRAESGSLAQDVHAAQALVEQSQARLSLSQGVWNRLSKLKTTGGVSTDELDRAQRDVEANRAAVVQSQAQWRSSQARRKEGLRTARAQLAVTQARIQEAQARLSQKTIIAPITGHILQIKVRAGEYYQVGVQPLVVMGDTSQLKARIDIDERDLAQVYQGQPALLRVPALPDQTFSAKVVEIGRRMGRKNVRTDDPAERNDTKILEVVLKIDAAEALIVGQRVDAFLTLETEAS